MTTHRGVDMPALTAWPMVDLQNLEAALHTPGTFRSGNSVRDGVGAMALARLHPAG